MGWGRVKTVFLTSSPTGGGGHSEEQCSSQEPWAATVRKSKRMLMGTPRLSNSGSLKQTNK